MMKLKVSFCNCFINAPEKRSIVGMFPAFSSANLPLLTDFVQKNLLCTQPKQHCIQHISTHIVRHAHLHKTSPQSDFSTTEKLVTHIIVDKLVYPRTEH